MPQCRVIAPSHCETGVGLIEILISLVVIAVGLLGLAALQGKAQHAEMESYQRSQALTLLQDMAARLRVNRAGSASYITDHADCSNTSSRAGQDLCEWSQALAGAGEILSGSHVGAMIGGQGCITGVGNDFVVTVAWQGLAEMTRSSNSPCGETTIANPNLRRTISIPVRFFIPDTH